jgi:hypothetical protein
MTMTAEADLPTRSAPLPPEIVAMAAAPPLIAGESSAGYDELLARICETLQPSDVLEQIWMRDIVDLVWEVFRLRRLKADLMAAAAHEGMAEVLRPLVDCPEQFAKGWARRSERTVTKVEAALAKAGSSMGAVAARTFSARIGDFERIERMLKAAEARRNGTLRELDRHRASFALRLRRTVQAAEDAEFAVGAPRAPAREEAA